MKQTVLIVILILLVAGCGKKDKEYPVAPRPAYPPNMPARQPQFPPSPQQLSPTQPAFPAAPMQLPTSQPQLPGQEVKVRTVVTDEGLRIIVVDTPNPSDEMMEQTARDIQGMISNQLGIGICVSPAPFEIRTAAGIRRGYGIGPCDIFGNRTAGQVAHGETGKAKKR